jgi:lipoprotein NlpI
LKDSKNDLDGAIADYDIAVNLRPNLAEAYDRRGMAKLAEKDLTDALADCDRAIELRPLVIVTYISRARVKEAENDLDGAAADCDHAVKIRPDLPEGYVYRAHLKIVGGDLAGALADCNLAIEIKPKLPGAYEERALAHKCSRHPDEALADINKAIELNPNLGAAFRSRGDLYYDLHSFTNSLTDLRHACELDPKVRDYASFHIWLNRAKTGDKKAATEELQAYLDERKPQKGHEWALRIGRFLTGQLSEDDLFKAAVNSNPRIDANQHCEAYYYAGSKRLIDGNKEGAQDYFKKCVATNVRIYTEFSSAQMELTYLENGGNHDGISTGKSSSK